MLPGAFSVRAARALKDFIYILLLLLAASMALGTVRWLGGEPFLPKLGPGEEDKKGRR
jgi:hypothetical protein